MEVCPDEAYRWALEYYVNQIHEMDAFVGELIQELEAQGRADGAGALWRSPAGAGAGGREHGVQQPLPHRVHHLGQLWAGTADEPLAAYQLSATVLGRLGTTTGLMTAFQQTCREEPTYRADLRMLQYDALYGKGTL